MRRGTGLVLAGTLQCGAVAYLLALLVASARRRAQPPVTDGPPLRFLVLVPAHDEEGTICRALDSLLALDYPADAVELLVIADNCTDATATLVRDRGVRVLERHEPAMPGKGRAIAWALEQAGDGFDALVVVDADCTASANLLRILGRRIEAGADAVQVRYTVANPQLGGAAALRYGGYALMNELRPGGKAALGLSAGLFGSGMAFTSALMARVPWSAFSIVEDHEQHVHLIEAGVRVVYAPEAEVSSPMPTALRRTSDQQLRWEQGRLRLAAASAPRLIRDGVRRRDIHRLHTGLELLIPPQSVLSLGSIMVGVVGAVRRNRAAARLGFAALLGQAAFVLGGLVVVRAPAAAFRALATAPLLIAQKFGLLCRIASRRGPAWFVRTERDE